MTSAFPTGKKSALCRYFMSTGSCTYGDDCQFLHQNPLAFQHQTAISNPYGNGSVQQNGMSNGQDNLVSAMPVQDSVGANGDQFFTATFSGGEGNLQDFQPFSRQTGPISRQPRNGSLGMVGNGSLNQANSPMSQSSLISSPFNTSSGNPLKAPISQSTPLSQQVPSHIPPQNGPISSMMNGGQMPPNMKQFVGSGNYDSSIASDFSALNLSVPQNSKGTNPHVSEFIPKLSHSASSPNFSSYNNIPSGGNLVNSTVPTTNTHLTGLSITSNASPNHSPRLSPANSPLLMRRAGSPVAPMRTNKPPPGSTIQENVGGTTYFYNAEDFTPKREGLTLPNFNMYHGPPPYVAHMKVKSNMPQFFMPDELKMEILTKNTITMAQIDLEQNSDIPREVDTYRNLFPLEPPADSPHHKSKTFGYPTTCYKALNTKDGQTYCLRRIHEFQKRMPQALQMFW